MNDNYITEEKEKEELEIDLGQFFRELKKRWRLIVLFRYAYLFPSLQFFLLTKSIRVKQPFT